MDCRPRWAFSNLIAAHGDCGGYCHITPEVFVLARPICRDWSEDMICNPQVSAENPDCWHVWLLAGDPFAALAFLPYPLPWVSYHRRDVLKVQPMAIVQRRFAR